jgi:hypothetical protein
VSTPSHGVELAIPISLDIHSKGWVNSGVCGHLSRWLEAEQQCRLSLLFFGSPSGKGIPMSDEKKDKVPVTLVVDRSLLERIDNAITHVDPGWDVTRVFEVGAVELLERLERKYNKGKPFPQFPK